MTKAAIQKLLKQKSGVALDLGCGKAPQPHFIGIDKHPWPAVDLVHDLEVFPWPLPDNCAHSVLISHFWEHVKPWLTFPFMAEVHRVARHRAEIFLAGPYGLGFRYVQDPTHCNPTNDATFYYFDTRTPKLWQVYRPPVFHVKSFERVPAGDGIDFNCVLVCCKAPGQCGIDGCTATAPALAVAG